MVDINAINRVKGKLFVSKIFIIVLIIGILVFLGIISEAIPGVSFIAEFLQDGPPGIIVFLIGIGLFMASRVFKSQAKRIYKDDIVQHVIEGEFSGYDYESHDSSTFGRYSFDQLFRRVTGVTCEDYISGTFDSHKFEFGEIHVYEKYKSYSGKRTTTKTRTYFRGAILRIDIQSKEDFVISRGYHINGEESRSYLRNSSQELEKCKLYSRNENFLDTVFSTETRSKLQQLAKTSRFIIFSRNGSLFFMFNAKKNLFEITKPLTEEAIHTNIMKDFKIVEKSVCNLLSIFDDREIKSTDTFSHEINTSPSKDDLKEDVVPKSISNIANEEKSELVSNYQENKKESKKTNSSKSYYDEMMVDFDKEYAFDESEFLY